MSHTLTDLIRTLNLTFGPRPAAPKWPGCRHRRRLPRAFVMTDSRRLAEPQALIARLPADVGVIVRQYDHPDRAAFVDAVVRSAHRRGLVVLVAGNARLARQSGADGIHLPGHQLRRRPRCLLQPPHWIVTAAVHGLRELTGIGALNVNAVLVSPIFPTTTRVPRPALGLVGLHRFAARTTVPVIALGGLDLKRIRRLGASADGFAGIGEFTHLLPARHRRSFSR